MTQIKHFNEKTPDREVMEKQVNDFLAANDGKITVRDIKYTADPSERNNVWVSWTVMVVYDTDKKIQDHIEEEPQKSRRPFIRKDNIKEAYRVNVLEADEDGRHL